MLPVILVSYTVPPPTIVSPNQAATPKPEKQSQHRCQKTAVPLISTWISKHESITIHSNVKIARFTTLIWSVLYCLVQPNNWGTLNWQKWHHSVVIIPFADQPRCCSQHKMTFLVLLRVQLTVFNCCLCIYWMLYCMCVVEWYEPFDDENIWYYEEIWINEGSALKLPRQLCSNLYFHSCFW